MGGRPIASLICVTIVVLPHSPRIVLPLALQPPPKSFNMFSTKLLAVFSLIVALCNAQTPTDVSDASSQNFSFLSPPKLLPTSALLLALSLELLSWLPPLCSDCFTFCKLLPWIKSREETMVSFGSRWKTTSLHAPVTGCCPYFESVWMKETKSVVAAKF